MFVGQGGITIGTLSTTFNPYPSNPAIFLGLLVNNLICFIPMSARIGHLSHNPANQPENQVTR